MGGERGGSPAAEGAARLGVGQTLRCFGDVQVSIWTSRMGLCPQRLAEPQGSRHGGSCSSWGQNSIRGKLGAVEGPLQPLRRRSLCPHAFWRASSTEQEGGLFPSVSSGRSAELKGEIVLINPGKMMSFPCRYSSRGQLSPPKPSSGAPMALILGTFLGTLFAVPELCVTPR